MKYMRVGLSALAITVASNAALAEEISMEAFEQAVEDLSVANPTERDPLTMNAAAVTASTNPGDSVIAVMKIKLQPTWYFYSQVPPTEPFIETEWILNPASGLEIVDDWAGPPSTRHKDLPGTRIHASDGGELVFFRELQLGDEAEGDIDLQVGLAYQICNPEYCLPVKTKSRNLLVSVESAS